MSDSAAIVLFPTATREPSIQTAFVRGIAWTGVARWCAQGVTWASTLVVARLLAPEDYGLVASAAVFTGFVSIVGEFGIGITVVTLRQLTSTQIRQLHALSSVLGVVAFAAVAALAPAIAAFYARPTIMVVVVGMAATFPLAGVRTVPAALLQRELRFKPIAVMESVQAIVGAAVTLAAASAGWRYWALVAGIVGSACTWTAMMAAARPVGFAWPRRGDLDAALTFTRHQLTGTIAWYCYSNADFAVAGRMLGATQVGVYSMAWTLARIVPERLAFVVMRLTPAFFSAIQHDRPALRTWLYRLTEAVSVVTFPSLIGLAIIAGDVVPLTAGPKWRAAVLPVRILAVYGAFDVLMQLVTRALVAAGDSRFVAGVGLGLLCALPPAFIVGAAWGPAGIALGWIAAAPVIRSVLWMRAASTLGLRARDYARALWPAASATLIMAAGTVVASNMSGRWPLADRTLFEVVVGVSVYTAAMWLLHRKRAAAWRREWSECAAA